MQQYWIFVVVIVLLLISWSLVTFWQRFLENLFYISMGWNAESTSTALLIAVLTTGSFLLIVWLIKVIGLIPNIDFLIYDYTDETTIGGPLDTTRRGGQRFRTRTIGRKVSPRGALPSILQNG